MGMGSGGVAEIPVDFDKLFEWRDGRIEDVRFWCEPEITRAAVAKIGELQHLQFDGFATFEARGYLLAGIACAQFGLPVLPLRKHKPFYDRMAHKKILFNNWKGESETLTVLTGSLPAVRRVLVIDDILDTGRSLKAGSELLYGIGIEIVGAFYLLNSGSPETLVEFEFPILSAFQRRLFL